MRKRRARSDAPYLARWDLTDLIGIWYQQGGSGGICDEIGNQFKK
jgi:hypothetical protein